VRQNLAIPLQMAGHENAKVLVRFEGERPAFWLFALAVARAVA